MSGLRAAPPTAIAGVAVQTVRDVQTGRARDADGTERALDLPPSNVLAFDLADGSRVLARPSGTEPKAKFYFEVRVPLADTETYPQAEARAAAALDALEADMLRQAGVKA
jgi:phosphomannomutase